MFQRVYRWRAGGTCRLPGGRGGDDVTLRACFSVFIVGVLVALAVFLVVEVALKQPYNMVSFFGYVVFLALIFVFSANPGKVRVTSFFGRSMA